jgi:hypothetical protein
VHASVTKTDKIASGRFFAIDCSGYHVRSCRSTGASVAKTVSENLFERFCSQLGIPLTSIATGIGRTPDYEIKIDGQLVIVEVVELMPTRDEIESDRLVGERGYGNIQGGISGDRVRKKITSSAAQIKARTNGKHPGILVIFDRRPFSGHLDPDNVRCAMYGLERIHITAPRDHRIPPYIKGRSYEPKRKMTENHNTSISAIGVLLSGDLNRSNLVLYHNKFAAVKIDTHWPQLSGVKQYRLANVQSGNIGKWVKVRARSAP